MKYFDTEGGKNLTTEVVILFYIKWNQLAHLYSLVLMLYQAFENISSVALDDE